MSETRHVAPTHHAYQIAETGEDFLITDRIFARGLLWSGLATADEREEEVEWAMPTYL